MKRKYFKMFQALLHSKWGGLVKMAGVLLIICVPMLLIMVVFKPFITQESGDKYTQFYKLPSDFDQDDLISIVLRMKDDREFAFYFEPISEENMGFAVSEAYGFLKENRDDEVAYRQQLTAMKTKVDALAVLFNSLDFPEDFYHSVGDYPHLSHALWLFLYEEFKLTLIGLCFKSTHDLHFEFTWSSDARQAARKLRSIIAHITQEQMVILNTRFNDRLSPSPN